MKIVPKMLWLIFIGLLTFNFAKSQSDECNSEVCQAYSARLKRNINSSVSPCENFYEFACGNYDPEIPSDKSELNVFVELNDKLKEQLNMTMNEVPMKDDINPLRLVKNFYQGCIDTKTINKIGLDHLVEKMKFLGGWPVVKNHDWNEKTWWWQKVVQDIELIGFSSNYLFGFGLIQDLKNDTRRILVVDQPGLGLSREFLVKGENETLVKAYHSYQVDMAVLFGAEREDAEKEMRDVLEFEFKLANITQSKEERRNPTKLYNLITVKELQETFSCIDWLNYMNSFIQPEKKINKDEVIMITNKQVFIAINALLNATPKRTIGNYLMWRVASSTSVFLSDDIRERRLEYISALTGVKKYQDRWKECTSFTSSYLSIATSALYIRSYFNQKSKEDSLELVKMIRNEFVSTLKSTEWMDEETREAALEKAKKMRNFIAYPEELKDDEKLIEYYEGLDIADNEFFKSFLKINRFAAKKEMSKFREPVDKNDWTDHANIAVINAFYSPLENSIQFPAGILQGLFFSADRPKYLNYGAIGFVIGHEITHGFDDQGRKFDADGNLKEWWAESTRKAYLEKAQCIIDQYGNFTEPTTGLNLNGVNTQGENIADNGGIIVAYHAYQKWAKDHEKEPKIPDFDLTPNQHFWLSAAQSWCGKTRVETMKLRIETDPHSPASLRIIGSMSNSKEFLEDFQCSKDSKMGSGKMCKVW